jgi:hypothetical protein
MSPISKTALQSNLRGLQSRLNTSPQARRAFLSDPARVLQREGVTLSPERARNLKTFLDKQTKVPKGTVTGAAVRPGGSPLATEVEVTVKVKF